MSLPIVLHLCWCAAALPIIARQHRTPASAGVWWLLVLLLPVAGTLLYLLAGVRTPPRPLRGDTGRIAPRTAALIALNCGARPTPHNDVTLLHNGNNAYSALISALQRASRSIHLEYYIIRDDRIGRTIADILMRKARSGVEVRVLYDAIGSWSLGSRKLLSEMRRAGVAIGRFEPLRFPWFTPHADRRNHRKIVVTDGRTAFLGGINIAKYYLDGTRTGRWRDEHLRIEGDAVADLQRLFAADWRRTTGEHLDCSRYIARHRIVRTAPVQIAWAEEGPSRLTLVEAFAAAIVDARRRVRISSPYFMPPTMLLDAIRLTARSGIRVQVMIPDTSDSPCTGMVADAFVDDLLAAGAELYRYGEGFLHAKVLIVDESIASVGTANMDYRSLFDNLEVTAFLYDRDTVRQLADTFDRDLRACRRITPEAWRSRPVWRRAVADTMKLLAPLM